jgi:hypothetical protein
VARCAIGEKAGVGRAVPCGEVGVDVELALDRD